MRLSMDYIFYADFLIYVAQTKNNCSAFHLAPVSANF